MHRHPGLRQANPMNVAIARVSLRLSQSRSLKTRRQAARSLTQRIRTRFNVSVAQDIEADGDLWQSLTLAVSCLSNDASYLESVLDDVVRYVENVRPDLEVLDYGIEVISGV